METQRAIINLKAESSASSCSLAPRDPNLIITGKREQITDLDSLPFLDRGLIDYRKYHQNIGQSGIKNCFTVQGSRGCPYRCIYCDVIKLSPMLYRRSAEHVFSEIQHLYSLGCRDIEFIDDIFNVNRKEFIRFFKIVIASGLKLNFYFQSGLRGDILTPEAIDVMMEGGVKSVNISLESASYRLQRLIKKNLNIDKFHANMQYMAENYPHAILGLNAMHGFPTETEEEARATVQFIKDVKWLHFAQLHNVRIFPGSAIEKLALENGITQEQINESLTLPYNAIPTTFHFDPEFSRKLRLDFVHSYVLNKERLKYVLQKQLEVCTEDEILFKYKSYFPSTINSIDDILRLARLKREEIDFSKQPTNTPPEIQYPAPRPKARMRAEDKRPLRILYVDSTQFFSTDDKSELRITEPPLGFMALLSHLNENFGDKIEGRILKSCIDYDSFDELLAIVDEFQPDIIGMRTLSYYKNFFRDNVAAIRSRHPNIPIIAGGPHPTIAYADVFAENDIQAIAFGEGELTNAEIMQAMLDNDYRFPDVEQLKKIKGIVFPEDRVRKLQTLDA